jgi:hypothetical protein
MISLRIAPYDGSQVAGEEADIFVMPRVENLARMSIQMLDSASSESHRRISVWRGLKVRPCAPVSEIFVGRADFLTFETADETIPGGRDHRFRNGIRRLGKESEAPYRA